MSTPTPVLALLLVALTPTAARADVPPRDAMGCERKAAGAACEGDSGAGTCQTRTTTQRLPLRDPYGKIGTRTTERPYLACVAGPPVPPDSPVIAADLDACRGLQVGAACSVGARPGACVATDAPWGGELVGGPPPPPTLLCDTKATPTAAAATAATTPAPAAPAPEPAASGGLCRVAPGASPGLLVLLLLLRRRRRATRS